MTPEPKWALCMVATCPECGGSAWLDGKAEGKDYIVRAPCHRCHGIGLIFRPAERVEAVDDSPTVIGGMPAVRLQVEAT